MSRICICTTNDTVQDQRMQRIATVLSQEGHDVTWIGRLLNDEVVDNQNYNVKLFMCWFNKGILFYLEFAIRQFVFLLSTKWDLVYACDVDGLVGAAFAKPLKGYKLVYDAHEYFYEVPELVGKPVKKWLWRCAEKIGVAFSDERITVSHTLRDVLSRIHHKDFKVIRNLPLFSKLAHQGTRDNIIIYQGVLNQGRCLEQVIAQMDQLPDYTLLICGIGDIVEELRTLAKDKTNVKFMGKIPPAQLSSLTEQAKFGINLLDGQSDSYRYSLANKFFDYANAGCVSINSRLPEYVFYADKHQHCLILDDVSELPQSIRKHESEYKFLAKKGREMIHELNWDSEKVELLKIINDLL